MLSFGIIIGAGSTSDDLEIPLRVRPEKATLWGPLIGTYCAWVLAEERGQTSHFALVPYRGLFWFWSENSVIALIAFAKCSPFGRINWLLPIVPYFKMLAEGTSLFLADYVYTYSLYTWTMIFFPLVSFFTVHLNLAAVPQTKVGACDIIR